MIRFACPSCQKAYKVPDQFAGRATKCRQCGKAMQVPKGVSPQLPAPVSKPAEPQATSHPTSKDSARHTVCDYCNKSIQRSKQTKITDTYAFISSPTASPTDSPATAGLMLLCESCADHILNDTNWHAGQLVKQKPTLEGILANPMGFRTKANGIIAACKRKGFVDARRAKFAAGAQGLILRGNFEKAVAEVVAYWATPFESDALPEAPGASVTTSKSPDRAVCDHCNGPIHHLQGFAFFCSGAVGIPGMMLEVGNMLLCDACTDQIVTDANWVKNFSAQKEMSAQDVLANPMAVLENLDEVKANGIIAVCKKRGLTPQQARDKARILAMHWWVDPQAALVASTAFWTSSASTAQPQPFSAEDEAYNAMCILTGVGLLLAVPGGIALAVALLGAKVLAIGRIFIVVVALAMLLGPALGWLVAYRRSRKSNREHLVLTVYVVLGLLGTAFGFLMVHLKWIASAVTG